METGLCAQTGRAHKALNLEAGYQLFTGLEDDVSSSTLYIYGTAANIIIYIYMEGCWCGWYGEKDPMV